MGRVRGVPDRPCGDCGRSIRKRYAQWCDHCRWRHCGKPRKYVWTEERDQLLRDQYDSRIKGRAQAIADQLGWPKWVIVKRAAVLGLTQHPADRREWTRKEVDVLETWARSWHVNRLAKRLGRSIASVVLKLKRLKIRRRVRSGYTMRMLEACFGTDHHVIERWVREGMLRWAPRNPDAPPKGPWQIAEAEVLRFIREHPMAFRLDKVDQEWFMGLVIGAGLGSAARTGRPAA